MIFMLYSLIDNTTGDFMKFPFIGSAEGRDYHLHITQNHIIFFEGKDTHYHEIDYINTGRIVDLNVALINSLVKDYISPCPFELIVWLDRNPHIIIYPQKFPIESTKAIAIMKGHPEKKACYLRDTLIGMMRSVLDAVNAPD